ncbi:MAG TPA: NAD(P)-dependent oxidoreductase [Patescibacteria group bacterium]|nr:NAD(P)-dependent oxidoreductase [Patescibacteria group bacterium]
MKVAITGASGLVGSRFFDLYKSKYDLIPISSSFGVDITDRKKLHKFLSQKNPGLIIHLAAKTNVDKCEEDKVDDLKKSKVKSISDLENLDTEKWKGSTSAFGVNVVGTKNLSDYAKRNNIKIIYVSTDFVFDGEKNGEYTEADEVSPINWYGQTKLYGEKVLGEESLIARISYPYGFKSNIKKDIVWTMVSLLEEKDRVELVTDQIITPTFIDDIVRALHFLIENNITGLVNVVGNNFLSPYEIGIAIASQFGLEEGKIEVTTRAKLYKGRAKRPFKVCLKNDKLRALGFEMTGFFESLTQINQKQSLL